MLDDAAAETKGIPNSGSLRRSGERRHFMQSPVDEADEDGEADAMSSSYTSIDSVPIKRVSLEDTDGAISSNTSTPPIRIPSRSSMRRTSARTNSSSWSPASAFLGRWNRDESLSTAEVVPDAEGQEIADSSKCHVLQAIPSTSVKHSVRLY